MRTVRSFPTTRFTFQPEETVALLAALCLARRIDDYLLVIIQNLPKRYLGIGIPAAERRVM